MKTRILTIFIIILSVQISQGQWVEMSNGIGSIGIFSLATSGSNIFAGSSIGIFVSADNGLSWTQTSLNNQDIRSMAVNGSNIYAGSYSGNGVFKSTDNGTTWSQTTLNNKTIRSLAVSGNFVYAGAYAPDSGVYRSTDNGITWSPPSLNDQVIRTLAVNGNYVFAGSGNIPPTTGVYRSTDNGSTWVLTSLHDWIGKLAISGNNIFESGNNHGLKISTDNGDTWYQTSLNGGSGTWYSLAFSGNNVFAGSYGAGIYMSTNNGLTWVQKNEGLTFSSNIVSDLCIHDNYIFAGIGTGAPMGVYRRPLGELIGIQTISTETPVQFSLSQNYPNPFNPSTKIKFSLPKSSNTNIVIYDALGMKIETLVNEQLSAGTYEVDWNAANYANGVYFYKLISGAFSQTNKMILLK